MKETSFSEIPVAILCGGRGTRLREETDVIPKPLVRIGERPVVWHIMKIYHAQGFRKFVLLVGYKGEKIKEYFSGYQMHHSDFTLAFGEDGGTCQYHSYPRENWEVTILDTGQEEQTGARIKRAEYFLKDGTFMLTYGDGVGDVDVRRLLKAHKSAGKMTTLTGVHPPGRFGELCISRSLVTEFREKPPTHSTYINGGFFVVEPKIFQELSSDASLNFEKDVLPRIAKKKELAVYKHEGFWQCMDTVHDMDVLNEAWGEGKARWKLW